MPQTRTRPAPALSAPALPASSPTATACVLLCRVSSKEQEDSGYSLPAQERLLSAYAQRNHLQPARTFHIAESAAGRTQRRIFAQMLDFLQQSGIPHLLCEKVDRLTRNNKDAVVVDEWLEADPTRRVHFVKDSLLLHKHARSQEKLNWGIRVVMAKNYSDNLSEEVRKGWEEKFASGIYPGASPFGYQAVEQGRRKSHAPDPQTAPWVRQMYHLVDTEGYSVRRLETHLRAQGVTARSGRPISRSNIYRCLTSGFYRGEIAWDGKQGQGCHEPLVTGEQWERVQVRLRRSEAPRYNVHAHLFQGLVRCAGCGGVITWERHKGHLYGHCNGYRTGCPERQRTRAWAKEEQVEAQVIAHLGALSLRDSRLAGYIEQALTGDAAAQAETDALVRGKQEATLSRVRQRLEVLYEDRLDGRITADAYDAKAMALKREAKGLETALSGTGKAVAVDTRPTPASVFSLGQRSAALFAAGETKERRAVVQEVFESLEMSGGGDLCVTYTPAFAALKQAVVQSSGSRVRFSRLPQPPCLELVKTGSGKQKTPCIGAVCPVWRETWSEFRTAVSSL